MTVSTTRKLISCTVCEYRLLQLEIEHYSFLLEFVEFFDEMKTPEIKKNMELCHHKYHLSEKQPPVVDDMVFVPGLREEHRMAELAHLLANCYFWWIWT